jgi:hypothetical protein
MSSSRLQGVTRIAAMISAMRFRYASQAVSVMVTSGAAISTRSPPDWRRKNTTLRYGLK